MEGQEKARAACPEGVSASLYEYVSTQILPLYDSFDKGHGRDHAEYVIAQALSLCRHYDVDPQMVFTAAAYHDTGLCKDRKSHHIVSAGIIRADRELRRWFNESQIDIIADAAEDHRASSDHEPRTIYGKLIAESDRQIVPLSVIRRTVQFGFAHYPELDREGHWQRTLGHLEEKYAEGGYLKLWIPESGNKAGLEELRALIKDRERLRSIFDNEYDDACRLSTKL
ncbi:MAG: HD domain-containing protein [Candidatus Cryptobacteroides sp.]